jgi:hypothetical protein
MLSNMHGESSLFFTTYKLISLVDLQRATTPFIIISRWSLVISNMFSSSVFVLTAFEPRAVMRMSSELERMPSHQESLLSIYHKNFVNSISLYGSLQPLYPFVRNNMNTSGPK